MTPLEEHKLAVQKAREEFNKVLDKLDSELAKKRENCKHEWRYSEQAFFHNDYADGYICDKCGWVIKELPVDNSLKAVLKRLFLFTKTEK